MDAQSARCNICGSDKKFLLEGEPREGRICSNCSASSRHRAVIYVLGRCLGTADIPLTAWPGNRGVKILESSGRGSYPVMLKEKFTYYNTEYRPAPGQTQSPSRHFADFQHLTYAEGEFDYVIATDVFEHIRGDDKAFSEVFRVLKNEGVFIMTVPYNHTWESTLVRVRPEGDKDVFLLPPEYHGGGGQTLAYRTYGRDLLARLRDQGLSVGSLDLEVPGYAIGRQFVFVGVKGPSIDLTRFHSAIQPARTNALPLLPFRMFVALKYNTLSAGHFLAEAKRRLSERFRKA